MNATVNRSGGAPGEWMRLSGTFANTMQEVVYIVIKLVRKTLLCSTAADKKRTRLIEADWELLKLPVAAAKKPDKERLSARNSMGERFSFAAPVEATTLELVNHPFRLPPVPASNHGGMLRDEGWEAKMMEVGMYSSTSGWFAECTIDPAVWWYEMRISFGPGDINDIESPSWLEPGHPFIIASIPQNVDFAMPGFAQGLVLGVAAAPEMQAMVRAEEVTTGAAGCAACATGFVDGCAAVFVEGLVDGVDIVPSVDGQPPPLPAVAMMAVPLEAIQDEVKMGAALSWNAGTLPGGAEEGAAASISSQCNFDGKRDNNPCNDLTYQPAFPCANIPEPESGEGFAPEVPGAAADVGSAGAVAAVSQVVMLEEQPEAEPEAAVEAVAAEPPPPSAAEAAAPSSVEATLEDAPAAEEQISVSADLTSRISQSFTALIRTSFGGGNEGKTLTQVDEQPEAEPEAAVEAPPPPAAEAAAPSSVVAN